MPSLNKHSAPELTIVIPTYNEKDNIEPLITKLMTALIDIHWELLLVDDDSPDNTADTIDHFAQQDRRIRCLRRLGRRGLSSACIEGFLASSSPYVAVMDADLQHDEHLLPVMLNAVQQGDCHLAVASRYVDNGSCGEALSLKRSLASKVAIRLSHALQISELSDPVSGFFLFRRSHFKMAFPYLYGQGYKILIDLLGSTKTPVKVQEFPYQMRPREAGDSKLELLIVLQYCTMLFVKLTGNRVPIKFLLFVLVGLAGVGVHLSILMTLKAMGDISFLAAQAIATWVAMTTNFLMNNMITYHDQRLHGLPLLLGLMSFYVVCSIGALINISFATMLERLGFSWIFCGTSGAAVGAVWNYTMSSVFTWTDTKRQQNR